MYNSQGCKLPFRGRTAPHAVLNIGCCTDGVLLWLVQSLGVLSCSGMLSPSDLCEEETFLEPPLPPNPPSMEGYGRVRPCWTSRLALAHTAVFSYLAERATIVS